MTNCKRKHLQWMLNDLLAVVHRDGVYYRSKEEMITSFEDALDISCKRIEIADKYFELVAAHDAVNAKVLELAMELADAKMRLKLHGGDLIAPMSDAEMNSSDYGSSEKYGITIENLRLEKLRAGRSAWINAVDEEESSATPNAQMALDAARKADKTATLDALALKLKHEAEERSSKLRQAWNLR